MPIPLQFLWDFASLLDLFTLISAHTLTLAVGVRSLWGSSHAQGKDTESSQRLSGAEDSFRCLGFLCINPNLSMLAVTGRLVSSQPAHARQPLPSSVDLEISPMT